MEVDGSDDFPDFNLGWFLGEPAVNYTNFSNYWGEPVNASTVALVCWQAVYLRIVNGDPQ